MKNLPKPGPYLFAFAIIGIGLVHIISGNFPSSFLPVPEMPGRTFLVYLTGIIFCLCGFSFFINPMALLGSIILGITLLLLFLYPHLPKLLSNLYDPGEWTVAAEALALCSGTFILTRWLMNARHSDLKSNPILVKTVRIAPYAFAVSLIVFTVQHFLYADFIAKIIPSWFPARLIFSYLVMTGFIGTSVNILFNVQNVNVAKAFGYMFLFILLVLHIPRVVNSSHIETEWTSMFIAMAMSGIGFMLSDIFLYNKSGRIK